MDSTYNDAASEVRTPRAWTFTLLWLAELTFIAASYGVLESAGAAWDMKNDLAADGLVKTLAAFIEVGLVVVCAAFMNFVMTGFVFTSLIARYVCTKRAPRIYPWILASLVIIHIEGIALMDGQWALTTNKYLFMGWGAAAAFAGVAITRRFQSRRSFLRQSTPSPSSLAH